MRKLILLLLAFLAVFTYIRAYERETTADASTVMSADISVELPMEILQY